MQHSAMVPEVAEAAVEAEEAEVAVEVVVNEDPITVVVKEVGKIKVSQAKVKIRVRIKEATATRGTGPPGMRTCPRSSPASGTGPMGNLHIFVLNRQHVPGRIISSLSLIIRLEGLTSSAMKT